MAYVIMPEQVCQGLIQYAYEGTCKMCETGDCNDCPLGMIFDMSVGYERKPEEMWAECMSAAMEEATEP